MSDILARFTVWANSELSSHYAQPCPDEIMDHLVSRAWEDVAKLAEIPAETVDDLLLKLFPLLLAEYEPKAGEPPMVPVHGENNGDAKLFASVIEDMRRLSPAIAQVMAAPHYSAQRRSAA